MIELVQNARSEVAKFYESQTPEADQESVSATEKTASPETIATPEQRSIASVAIIGSNLDYARKRVAGYEGRDDDIIA